MRVYLAGPINGCTNAEVNDWRAWARVDLEAAGLEVSDPMGRDYRGMELDADNVREIVEGDKADIAAADIILAYCHKRSAGTSMEVLYAHGLGKYVVVVGPFPLSPWLVYHATAVSDSLEAAIEYIVDEIAEVGA